MVIPFVTSLTVTLSVGGAVLPSGGEDIGDFRLKELFAIWGWRLLFGNSFSLTGCGGRRAYMILLYPSVPQHILFQQSLREGKEYLCSYTPRFCALLQVADLPFGLLRFTAGRTDCGTTVAHFHLHPSQGTFGSCLLSTLRGETLRHVLEHLL